MAKKVEEERIVSHISEYIRVSQTNPVGAIDAAEETSFVYGFSENEAYGFISLKDIRS